MLFRARYRDRKTREWHESKNWSYEFQFRGSRIRETTRLKSKKAAGDAERERRRQLAEGSAGIRRVEPLMLRKAAEDWIALKQGTLSANTLRIRKTGLSHLLPTFGSKLVNDIEAADVARYQQRRLNEGAEGSTVNLELAMLRAVLRRSGAWSRIQVDVKPLPERESPGLALTAEQEARLLDAAAESRSRALLPALVIALNTGLRRAELASLRWEQVDFDSRRIAVGRSKTKAGSGRKIPMNDRAFEALSTWAKRFPFRQADHAVFPTERYGAGGAVYEVDPTTPTGDFSSAFEAAKKRTADPENGLPAVVCRWHDLRHTFCTRVLESGQTLPMLARLMGWSAGTTIRLSQRYGHFSPAALSAAVSKLDEARK